jgi:malate dehydrogenase (oxaloacetate-decarboxylating)(NADP+)
VPEAVVKAYGGRTFTFGRDYLIPKPFDPRVLWFVAPAVAKAAMDTGSARIDVELEEYRDRLRASLGPGREVMRWVSNRARAQPMRVVLVDGLDERVIQAASHLVEEGIARPILVGTADRIRRSADELGANLEGVDIIDPDTEDARRERYALALYEVRHRKGMTRAEARSRVREPIFFAGMMVRQGDADAVVAGVDSNYPEVIRPALEVVGTAAGVRRVCGLYMVAFPERAPLFFADTTVNIDPDAGDLAEIALLSASFVRELGLEPRVAMLSFSNFGSAPHAHSKKVRDAVRLVKELDPDLQIDGEMQADTAVSRSILKEHYPFSDLDGPANVLVFPDLGSANISYKLLDQLGGAEVIGPILLGMRHPVHVLQRGSTSLDVLNLATIASVDAQTPFSHN